MNSIFFYPQDSFKDNETELFTGTSGTETVKYETTILKQSYCVEFMTAELKVNVVSSRKIQ